MIEPAADSAAARRADDDRHRRAAAVAVPQCGGLVDDLIEAARDEVGELHLRHRPIPAQRRADADADDGRLRDRRIDDAHLAELFEQSLRRAERAAVGADILPEDEYFRITAHFFGECLADGLEIREFLTHRSIRAKATTKTRKHEEDIRS